MNVVIPERLRDRPARDSGGGPLVVVGDALLDVDLDGRVERLCPDAPVPVVDDITERPRPGGAALAAALAARDGLEVVLVTPLADDEGADRLRHLLAGVVDVLGLPTEGSTSVKKRVRAGGQTLVRLDSGGRPGAVGELSSSARDALQGASAVLVSDYGRGTTAAPSVRAALTMLAHRVPLVWDPHPKGSLPVAGAALATPNRAEALAYAARLAAGAADRPALPDTAAALAAAWQAHAVAVTLGAQGALLHTGSAAPVMVSAPPVTCVDACGAGDRFAATAASLLGRGCDATEAVHRAVIAASRFVAAGGASQVSRDGHRSPGLSATSSTRRPTEHRTSAVFRLIEDVRARGGVVVATGGCFD
ncbi:MAG: D-beta-D-heptose 1-phosphate adenosyltransferase, partial [Jiangellaceae bacterium]|nr:D-beta-D-heptose 1-phosphate adenosyltransferase [Jiangellaceae bacterium]